MHTSNSSLELSATRIAELEAQLARAEAERAALATALAEAKAGQRAAELALAEQRAVSAAATAEVQEQKDLYRSLTENLPDLIARLDRHRRVTYVSPNIEQFTGLPVSAFVGQSADELGYSGGIFAPFSETLTDVFDTGTAHSVELPPLPPEYPRHYEFRILPERDADGAVATVLIIGRDVTEQRQAEAALREHEMRLLLSLEVASMIAWEWSPISGAISWHGDPQHSLGLTIPSGADFAGVSNFIPPEEQEAITRTLAAASSTGSFRIEHRYRRDNDTEGWIESYGRVLEASEQGPVLIVGVSRDITRRKQLEANLLRQTKTEGMLTACLRILHSHGHDEQARGRIFAAVAAELRSGVEAAHVMIWSLDTAAVLRLVAADGVPFSANLAISRDVLPATIQRLLLGQTPDPGYDEVPAFAALAEAPATYHVLPIGWPGQLWGLVALGVAPGTALAAEELNFAATVAEIISTTLRRWLVVDALQAREQTLRLAMEAAQLGSFELNPATNTLDGSGRFAQLMGLAHQEPPYGLNELLERLHPVDQSALMSALSRLLANSEPIAIEGRVVQEDGTSLRWVRSVAQLFPGHNGAPERILGVLMDVTEQREAQETLRQLNADLERRVEARTQDLATTLAKLDALYVELRRSDRLLRTIINSLDEGLALIHADGRVLMLNQALSNLLGIKGYAARGRPWRELFGFASPLLEQALAEGLSFSGRERIALSGKPKLLDVQAIPLPGAQGRPQIVLRMVDMTEKLQFEDLALKNERLAATGRLAAIVAHEVNSPLQAIQNFLFLAASDNRAERDEYLKLIAGEIDRIGGLIRRLLDLQRPGDDTIRVVDANALIEKVLALTSSTMERHRVVVNRSLSTRAALLTGRGDQLTQVLLNLILNAIDAMPHGGALTIRSRHLAAGGQADFDAPAGILVVEVEDTGQGIPSEVLPHIFEPFFTTKSSGSGLGLAISRQIVEQHGGKLSASHSAARGACFTVALPAAPA